MLFFLVFLLRSISFPLSAYTHPYIIIAMTSVLLNLSMVSEKKIQTLTLEIPNPLQWLLATTICLSSATVPTTTTTARHSPPKPSPSLHHIPTKKSVFPTDHDDDYVDPSAFCSQSSDPKFVHHPTSTAILTSMVIFVD